MQKVLPVLAWLVCVSEGRRVQGCVGRFQDSLRAESQKPWKSVHSAYHFQSSAEVRSKGTNKFVRLLALFCPNAAFDHLALPARIPASIGTKNLRRSEITLCSTPPTESVQAAARPPGALLGLAATAAVAGISSSAVLVRGMSGEAHALAIAAWRTSVAAALQIASGRAKGSVQGQQLLLMSGAGVLLALHFYLWFLSLSLTSVLRSTVLVSTVPVWSGLIEALRGSALNRKFWNGNLLALLGVALTAKPGVHSTSVLSAINPGDIYATLAAVAFAVYLQIGKRVRAEVKLGIWQGLVCGFAALTLWPVAMLTHVQMWGFSAKTWALMAGIIVGPQLIGHQCLDYIVKWLPASTVAMITLLEPVGAGTLAAWFFHEYPTPVAVLGALLALVGVCLAV